jgi:L-fuculose-phosphate aldolase
MTMRLRDELVITAKRMSELGLTPGMSGNVSVRGPSGMIVTPSGMPYSELRPDDAVEIKADGTLRPGQRAPSTEWQLHRDILGARQDVHAIVHTHSLYCTTISMLRRPIPAVHYMIVLAGSDEIPCADYATFGSAMHACWQTTAWSRSVRRWHRRSSLRPKSRRSRLSTGTQRKSAHLTYWIEKSC